MEQVTRWDVVLIIIALFTFIFAVIKLMVPLVKNLTRLTVLIEEFSKHCTKTEADNTEDHKEFRKKLDYQGTALAEHGSMLQAHDIVIKEVLSGHTQ